MTTKTILCLTGIYAFALLAIVLTQSCRETVKPGEKETLDLGYLLDNKDMQDLGEKLFFDARLSDPEGQSCAACHGPEVGWTGPDEDVNKAGGVYPGAIHERFGNRKPNSSGYASLSPLFHAIREDGRVVFVGGNFWDGRATGSKLGNPAADQAQGPFLNPVEQNIGNAEVIIEKVCNSDYAGLFKKVADEVFKLEDICASTDVNLQYGIVGLAIAAYENSAKVNQFTSKFDYYLKGEAELTTLEKEGLNLFEGKGKCSLCHSSRSDADGNPPLFTDFTFDNLGIPKNPLNPWYKMDTAFNPDGEQWVDAGLADFLKTMPQYTMYTEENFGKHQVPTLRNVDKRPSPSFVKAYGHNGYFKSLEEIVHFYNTRDVLPASGSVDDPIPGVNSWPGPEVKENINMVELGNLGLTGEEEKAIVEFMKTLSDGYIPAQGE